MLKAFVAPVPPWSDFFLRLFLCAASKASAAPYSHTAVITAESLSLPTVDLDPLSDSNSSHQFENSWVQGHFNQQQHAKAVRF